MKRQDDFSPTLIRKLRDRVAHRCSNPDCRVPTSAPRNDSDDKPTNIGKAAHICAASEGGPRYSAEMPSAERKSISNAIWLCSNCAVVIDVDETRYPVALLHKWKVSAEASALAEVGKRLPSEGDARDQLVSALGGMPKKFRHSAISNVHAATEQLLNGVDPRFNVKTSHDSRGTRVELHVKESVPFRLKIERTRSEEWIGAMKDLLDHGRDVHLPAQGVVAEGSPLFQEIGFLDGRGGVLSIQRAKQPAVIKMTLINPEDNEVVTLDDIQGHMFGGEKSFSVGGKTFDGLFEMELRAPFGQGTTAHVSFITIFEAWNGTDVRRVPYLSKLEKLFECALAGWQVNFAVEFKGELLMRGISEDGLDHESILASAETIRYIRSVATIAGFLDLPVDVEIGQKIDREEWNVVCDVARIMRGEKIFVASDLTSTPSTVMTADSGGENIKIILLNPEVAHQLVFHQNGGQVKLFGKSIALPMLEICVEDVFPKIGAEVEGVVEGDGVPLDLIPGPNFRCRYRYLRTPADSSIPVGG